MGNNGNNGNNGNGSSPVVPNAANNFVGLTKDEAALLLPGITGGGPAISGALESTNPGARLLSNDETLTEMLKGLNFDNVRQSTLCALALGENEIFLYDKDGKIDPRVEKIRNRIKWKATAQCSVKGLWVDQYKQTAIGVATSTVSANKGFIPVNAPWTKPGNDNGGFNGSNKLPPNNKRS